MYQSNLNAGYSDFLNQMQAVKQAKQHFLQTGELLPVVRPPVAEMWKACTAGGMRPETDYPHKVLPPAEVKRLRDENSFLIEAASSVIETICSTIGKIEFGIHLYDKSGHLLYAREVQNLREAFPEAMSSIFELGYCGYVKEGPMNAVTMALDRGGKTLRSMVLNTFQTTWSIFAAMRF